MFIWTYFNTYIKIKIDIIYIQTILNYSILIKFDINNYDNIKL